MISFHLLMTGTKLFKYSVAKLQISSLDIIRASLNWLLIIYCAELPSAEWNLFRPTISATEP
jgi:hypothetical protein